MEYTTLGYAMTCGLAVVALAMGLTVVVLALAILSRIASANHTPIASKAPPPPDWFGAAIDPKGKLHKGANVRVTAEGDPHHRHKYEHVGGDVDVHDDMWYATYKEEWACDCGAKKETTEVSLL
jgi:hypothetical protein